MGVGSWHASPPHDNIGMAADNSVGLALLLSSRLSPPSWWFSRPTAGDYVFLLLQRRGDATLGTGPLTQALRIGQTARPRRGGSGASTVTGCARWRPPGFDSLSAIRPLLPNMKGPWGTLVRATIGTWGIARGSRRERMVGAGWGVSMAISKSPLLAR